MIEVDIVARMGRRALLLGPLIAAAAWVWGGPAYGVSAAVGVAMTLANLWLAARIIGGVAESNPHMLVPAALGSFMLGLLLLTGASLLLRSLDLVYFPVTGFALIGSHLGLVLWEASGAHPRSAKSGDRASPAAKARS